MKKQRVVQRFFVLVNQVAISFFIWKMVKKNMRSKNRLKWNIFP